MSAGPAVTWNPPLALSLTGVHASRGRDCDASCSLHPAQAGQVAGRLPPTPRVQSLLHPPPESTRQVPRRRGAPHLAHVRAVLRVLQGGAGSLTPAPTAQPAAPTAARLRHRCRCPLKAECCSRRPHGVAPGAGTRAGPARKAGDRPAGSDAAVTVTAAETDAGCQGRRLTFLCRQPKIRGIDDVPLYR